MTQSRVKLYVLRSTDLVITTGISKNCLNSVKSVLLCLFIRVTKLVNECVIRKWKQCSEMPCRTSYRRFGGTSYLHLQVQTWRQQVLWNVGTYLPIDTESYSRRSKTWSTKMLAYAIGNLKCYKHYTYFLSEIAYQLCFSVPNIAKGLREWRRQRW